LERTNRRSAQEYDKLQKLFGVHKTLTMDMLKGGGLDAVSKSLAEHVGGDVVIVGPNQLVLAAWPPTASVAESEEWQDARNTITFNDSQDVVVPVMVEGELLAWVLAHLSRPMSEVDRTALEYGALLTALDLLRERTAIEVETRLRGGFVEELFGGDFDEETTLKQGQTLGLDLSRSSRVFLIESASGQTARADIESIYGVLSDVARTRPDEGIVAIRGPSVVAIFPDPERGSSEHVQLFEDQALSTLQSRLPQLPINLAVGTLCDSLSAYKASFQAAQHGLDLLRLLGRSGEVFSFRDSGIEHLLLQATDPHMVLGLVDSFVTPLEEYDSGHSSHLRESLQTFYAMGLNLEATARRLHIHVSTLRYRLGKIEELLGIDVRGPQRLDAELALRAATVFSAYRS
jgi:sugar diacid utilization regulator